ncbi:MAG: PilZ domain-containing protein [Deltaproteobacteria bacterium]|nr:PilZ domain-containing protein [Deltaproteobacteria bacterium]
MSSPAKRGRCGVTRNASGKGLLVVTPSRFALGEELELSVHLPGHAERRRGRVVRIEENGPSSHEVWRYRYAIELERAIADEMIESAQARAAELAFA